MDKRVKSLWVKALRSGEYRQGHNQLVAPEGYCCLGVLCDLYRRDTGLGEWTDDGNFVAGPDLGDRSDIALPMSVAEWAGLESCSPVVVREDGTTDHLILLNDDPVPFATIADLIEASL